MVDQVELLEALKPFARAAEVKLCASEGYWSDDKTIQGTDVAFYITFGDLKRAKELLDKLPHPNNTGED